MGVFQYISSLLSGKTTSSTPRFKVNGWKDYWKLFDELISLLKAQEKDACVADFIHAQRTVNGLTDGWFDFLDEFERMITKHRHHMTNDQLEIANCLAETLRKTLARNSFG